MLTDLETDDGVTIVRFDNAPVNALDLDLLEVIIAAMGSVQGPVVLTGAGRAFSAGVDLRALVDGGRGYAERFRHRAVGGVSGDLMTTPHRWSLRSTDMRLRAAVSWRCAPMCV